ncbi:MAG: hypothetical protein IJV82_06005 [Oscillospiraceae bacterium]|nr:hypothetical protein [Oscillospiraceae bacterium]
MKFRKKNEFRPDVHREDILGKILLTRKQRQTLLRWFLFSAVCVAALVIQDVVMSRVSIFDTTTDLVPCCILAVCILQGGESGSIFALVASLVYYFSGSAPGVPCIPILTFLAVFAAIFRQAYLRQGFITLLLLLGVCLVVYELAIFGIALFMKLTIPQRLTAHCVSAGITLVSVPLLYPILMSIGKIGGETWKE